MTLESLANELAKLLADFIHSLVSSKLEKMADRIRGPLAILELGSSGEPLARLLTVLNETVLRVGPLELDLIDRVAKRGDRRSDLRPLPVANSNFTQRRTSMNGQDDLRPRYPMNRRTFVSMVAAGAASTLVQRTAIAAQVGPKARNVVLVHGLFADGSSWSEVIARLQAAGLNATSVQNPLTTLPEAVASAERVLARQDGPTVLVGHSFSGMIVTEAGMHPNVSALVYVAARAPDAGEDYTALAKTFPTPPASAGVVFDGDEGRLSEAAFLRDFAGDLPEAKAKVLYAVQWPFQKALLTGKTTHAAWRSKPSFYAVSTEDRTINPDLERFMAKRMSAKTIEVKASHLSLISHPDEITRLILEAAGQPA